MSEFQRPRALMLARAIATALCTFRFEGPNRGKKRNLVMAGGKINKKRLDKEYVQVVERGPAAIRWCQKNRPRIDLQVHDARLVEEVTRRPNLPEAVKDHVKVLLGEMARRQLAGDGSDDSD